MEWMLWVGVAAVGIGLIALIIWVLNQMSPEKRTEAVINWLKGIVAVAEDWYSEKGKGAEKMTMVITWFEQYAPRIHKWFVKHKGLDIRELAEQALAYMKEHNWHNI